MDVIVLGLPGIAAPDMDVFHPAVLLTFRRVNDK